MPTSNDRNAGPRAVDMVSSDMYCENNSYDRYWDF